MRIVPGPTATLRLLAAGGLVAIAVVHLLDLPGKLDETPYLGVLYILGPIITSLLAAALIVGSRSRIGWLLAGAIAAATAIGYCLSRTTGLPHADDDIGNWTEPLGIASLIAEGTVMLLAASYLTIIQRRGQMTQSPAGSPRQVREPLRWGPTTDVGKRMPHPTTHSAGEYRHPQ